MQQQGCWRGSGLAACRLPPVPHVPLLRYHGNYVSLSHEYG
jgi:hypothetical protein